MGKRTKASATTKARKAPRSAVHHASTLPAIHASQDALGRRAFDLDESKTACILTTEPGGGKTRAMAQYLSLRNAVELAANFYVGSSAYMCHKQSYELGANFKYCYQVDKQGRESVDLLTSGRSVVTTMTPKMFRKMLFGDDESEHPLAFFKRTLLASVLSVGCTKIRFVLDEIHSITLADEVAALRATAAEAGVEVIVAGLTATPPHLDDEEELRTYQKLTGREDVQLVTYSDAELSTYNASLRQQPTPGSFTKTLLADPTTDPRHAGHVADLKTLLLGGLLAEETTIKARACMEHVTSEVVADQAHACGGAVFKTIDKEQMRQADAHGQLGEPMLCYESVIIAHGTLCGASKAYGHLEALVGTEGAPDYNCHDLRTSNICALDTAIDAFKSNFRAQARPQLAVINPSMVHSTNAFEKNVSGALAVGGTWDKRRLTQLAGRLGRPCQLQEGDIVTDSFKLVHIDSEWQRNVLGIRSARVSARAVKHTEQVSALLDELEASALADHAKKAIEQACARLARADEKRLLGQTAMAQEYMEAVLDTDKKRTLLDEFEDACARLITYKEDEPVPVGGK